MNVKLKNQFGDTMGTRPIKFRWTSALKSYHADMRGLGWSMAIIPGLDPRQIVRKECQDNALIAECNGTFLFGIFDGHGRKGKQVSDYCVKYWRDNFSLHIAKFHKDPKTALYGMLFNLDNTLKKGSNIDSSAAGSTAVLVYFDFQDIYVANLGDSRWVIGTTCDEKQIRNKDLKKILVSGNRILDCEQYTRDHNSQNSAEAKRIKQNGGKMLPVSLRLGSRGPWRVWKTGTNHAIAMTRSIGDDILSTVGVYAQSEVKKYTWDWVKDQFLILASDGVWDTVENIEAINFVEKFRDQWIRNKQITPAVALASPSNSWVAQLLCEYARMKWFTHVQEDCALIDDISAVIVEFSPFTKERRDTMLSETHSVEDNPR